MPLAPGTTIGPYTIVGPLGAGGMGEVYRARDARLHREVAIKVLPATLVADSERLRRFEQEARATGQLNHPNIVVVYDIGTHDGAPYVVEELLEGQTLRERLETGLLPARKAIDFARQIALGLAAAHQKGIVHRDLKPENLFVTHDGRVKILDFGLAKLTRPETDSAAFTSAPTAAGAGTGAGVILGTVGYMSPEQVRGHPADHRSDIFSFGSILYEMLAGRRAFSASSSIETMSAILKEDPPPLARASSDLPPGLERIVQHCLEKLPDERFQSARDLGFQLEALSLTSSGSIAGAFPAGAGGPGPARAGAGPRGLFGARVLLWPAVAAAAVLAAAGYWAGRSLTPSEAEATYTQMTFRSGAISGARFAPDGETVVYSAAWDGRPTALFSARSGSPESRSLELPSADLLSISRSGELAILLDPHFTVGWMRQGTLARASLAGGAPREVMRDVEDADWAPDGESLAVVRTVAGRYRLEFPTGKVLYETDSWLTGPRFSPDGKLIAFTDHPSLGDDRGRIAVVDLAGKVRFLTDPFASTKGVAWTPDGRAIWFSAGRIGNIQAVHEVDLQGRQRMVDGAPTGMTLADISATGRTLIVRYTSRRGIAGVSPDDPAEHDLSWLDWSRPATLSRDGRQVLFEEQGQGGGAGYSVYLRPTDGGPAVRLGRGSSLDLSPDGRWALTTALDDEGRLTLLPTGAGEPRTRLLPGLQIVNGLFLPDGRRAVVLAIEAGHGQRYYLVDFEGSAAPRPISAEGAGLISAVSPDGGSLAASVAGAPVQMWPIEGGGDPVPLRGSQAGDVPVLWGPDDRTIYVSRNMGKAVRVDRIDITNGRRTVYRTLAPADPAGIVDVDFVTLSADARAYVYSYRRSLSAL
ncbi:MAG TPA: protein kinase, partial [Candidatus Polarisedimenticolia bacterium]|nr:protein kinase [Candidatus Polarisedimenticolia bacterium]